MNKNQEHGLRDSQRLELLANVFRRGSIRTVLDKFSSKQIVEAHGFLWDKLVEIHYLTQNRDFRREEITNRMVPSATYQLQQDCDLRLDYCKGVECIWSNPICAGNKVKNNMEVMAESIIGYIEESLGEEDRVGDRNAHEKELWLE